MTKLSTLLKMLGTFEQNVRKISFESYFIFDIAREQKKLKQSLILPFLCHKSLLLKLTHTRPQTLSSRLTYVTDD